MVSFSEAFSVISVYIPTVVCFTFFACNIFTWNLTYRKSLHSKFQISRLYSVAQVVARNLFQLRSPVILYLGGYLGSFVFTERWIRNVVRNVCDNASRWMWMLREMRSDRE